MMKKINGVKNATAKILMNCISGQRIADWVLCSTSTYHAEASKRPSARRERTVPESIADERCDCEVIRQQRCQRSEGSDCLKCHV